MSKILACSCKHSFQDKEYGVGKRLHTFTKKKMWRCTICLKEKQSE